MISISKNVYIDKLDDIFYKYNNKYHWTITMKRQGLKCKAKDIYIDFNKEKNNKGPNFKAVDHVRISKY